MTTITTHQCRVKFLSLVFLSCLCFVFPAHSQVGINTATVNSKAAFEIQSTTKGLLIPRMTATERIAIAPANPARGLIVFDTDSLGLMYWTGSAWKLMTIRDELDKKWGTSGNTGIITSNFIGNIDSVDLNLRTNNLNRIRVKANGDVGIGVNNTGANLHVGGSIMAIDNLSGGDTINFVNDRRQMFFQGETGAFRAGFGAGNSWNNSNLGFGSVAFGDSTVASASNTIAVGRKSIVTQQNSGAFGDRDTVQAESAFAFGSYNKITSTGAGSFAVGVDNKVSGNQSFAANTSNLVSGNYAAAFGSDDTVTHSFGFTAGWHNKVSGNVSAAFGAYNKISTATSFAAGQDNHIDGQWGTGFGVSNLVKSSYGFAAGQNNITDSVAGVALGSGNQAKGPYSFAVGNNNDVNKKNSAAIGYQNVVNSESSFAAGYWNKTEARYGMALGFDNEVDGEAGVALGYRDSAMEDYSTAIGTFNKATGLASVAIGHTNLSTGLASVAMGSQNKALNAYSFVGGYNNRDSAIGTFIWGEGNFAKLGGTYSGLIGLDNQVWGTGGLAAGEGNVLRSTHGAAIGSFNTLYGSFNTALGDNNSNFGSIGVQLLGSNNQVTGAASSNCFVQGYDNEINTGNSVHIIGHTNETNNTGNSYILGANNRVVNNSALLMGSSHYSTSFSGTAIGFRDSLTGSNSFAIGNNLKDGGFNNCFIMGSVTSGTVSNTGNNQMLMHFPGGYRLQSNITGTTGVTLAGGSGTWVSLSDKNSKTNITAINEDEILAKVAAMPISQWNYKSQDDSIKHIGPMAQDFHEAFKLGDTDKGISVVDADGINMAAIKALNKKLEILQEVNEKLLKRIEKLEGKKK